MWIQIVVAIFLLIGFLDDTINHDRKVRCLTSVTPECNVRSETSVTVSSRLNASIVLWGLNNLTPPTRVGLKLSSWRLESVAGLLSTRLATALYCPLRWRLRTFEMGILAMWMMENVRYLSGHLHVANVTEFMIAAESGAAGEPLKRGLPAFSSLFSTVIWVKNCRSKKALNSA